MLDPVSGDSVAILSFGLVNDAQAYVTAEQAQAIAATCAVQFTEDVDPLWGLPPTPIKVFASLDDVPTDSGIFVLRLVSQTDQPGSLGYHDGFFAEVEVAAIIQAGCGVLTNSAPYPADTVSSVASHEFIETKVDPDVNLWVAVGPSGQICDAFEAADPVQGSFYVKNGVQVSDFVTPQWFIPGLVDKSVQFDFMKVLDRPFQVAPGGYVVEQNSDGSTTDVFGEKVPIHWRMAMSRRRKLRHDPSRSKVRLTK